MTSYEISPKPPNAHADVRFAPADSTGQRNTF
jgi:hypothetical protein